MGEQVKTRVSFEEWRVQRGFSEGRYDHETIIRREAWYGALANVELPSGRFDIPDWPEGATHLVWQWHYKGVIGPTQVIVRPLPQTVELTVEERLDGLREKAPLSWQQISVSLANGQTLDQLCKQYGVATTREVV